MNQKFPSTEKLKSKIVIDRLFSEGNSIKKFPIKLIYLPIKTSPDTSHKTGVSVPKRSFKKAVDRNHLKRLMREAYRKNKYLVYNDLQKNYAFMFIYTGREKFDYHKISQSLIWVLTKIKEKDDDKEK